MTAPRRRFDGAQEPEDTWLDARLRERIADPEEPPADDDWADVLAKARGLQHTGRRTRRTVATAAAAVFACAAAAGLALVHGSGRPERLGAAAPPLAGTVAATRSKGSATLVLYSQTTQEAFMRNADGRARGDRQLAFNAFNTHLVVRRASGDGPQPGDEESFRFVLYRDASLADEDGSEVMTCVYELQSQAMCDASIDLNGGGTLSATGLVPSDSTKVAFVLTGGTGRYASKEGAVEETPLASHGGRLEFEFV